MYVYELPPIDSYNNFVKFDSQYGMCLKFFLLKNIIHFDKTVNEVFIEIVSFL